MQIYTIYLRFPMWELVPMYTAFSKEEAERAIKQIGEYLGMKEYRDVYDEPFYYTPDMGVATLHISQVAMDYDTRVSYKYLPNGELPF